MCGIVGYLGTANGMPFLSNGLRRLEHRGYDSAGMAFLDGRQLCRYRAIGRVDNLLTLLPDQTASCAAIAHTRWATHGEVTEQNAHPHLSNDGRLAIVHNGIIDNYQQIAAELSDQGFSLASPSDSAVIPVLLEFCLRQLASLEQAIKLCITKLKGTFGLLVLDRENPETIIAARCGSPLWLAKTDSAMLIASEPLVFQGHSDLLAPLHDNEIAVLRPHEFAIFDFDFSPLQRKLLPDQLGEADAELAGYSTFMLKEIEQQPQVINQVIAGRLIEDRGSVRLSCLEDLGDEIFKIKRIQLTACGTSYHAALLGAYYFNVLARIPCTVTLASELCYSNPIVFPDDLCISLSQSGETADTIRAVAELQQRGAKVLSICNQVGSSLARLCGSGVYLHAGTEVAVASTKTFTAQVMALLLIAIRLGRLRHLSLGGGQRLLQLLRQLPEQLETVLLTAPAIAAVAAELKNSTGFVFIGRGISYPIALEGALKLKEIAYLPCEGIAGGEIKHGTLALINETLPTIALLPTDELYQKNLANIAEIRARKGKVVAISNQKMGQLADLVEYHISVPTVDKLISPFVNAVAVQLYSYFFARQLGCDVDHPRNLAKSVTVE